MYAVRGSWVGQTFALAASNSSGERKSRTRRSKEERKALAESFIKRYQSSNGGNFPSLNLTHKEVGGSFYTVREIVREIIQENKVLGPAKYTSEVNEDDTISHGYPLGSISMEPQDFLLQSQNGTNVVSNLEEEVKQTIDDSVPYSDHQNIGKGSNGIARRSEDTNENLEVSLNSNGHFYSENEPHNGKSTDVIDTIRSSYESDNLLVEQLVNKKSEVDGKLGLVGAYNAKLTIPTEEVEVETFPLKPAVKESNEEGSTSTIFIDSPSDPITENEVDGSPVSNLDGDSGAGPQHAVVDNTLNLSKKVDHESESLIMKKDSQLLIDGHSDLMRTAEVSKELDGFQGTAHGEIRSKTSSEHAGKEPLFMSANENDASMLDQSKRGTSPTLDRINLESWPRTSKQGTNPLLAFIETLKDAFVKFLSA